jgi:Mrp family chromosome partitioning ATPase
VASPGPLEGKSIIVANLAVAMAQAGLRVVAVDAVLIASSPVLTVADAAALAPAVDGVLLALQAGHTRRKAARHAVESLRQVGANLVGIVLNAVPTHRSGYDYYEYYRDRGERRKHHLRRWKGSSAVVQRLFGRR